MTTQEKTPVTAWRSRQNIRCPGEPRTVTTPPVLPSGPPQEQPGAHEDDGPPGGDLDEATGPEAELLQTVDFTHDLHDAAEGS